MENTNIYELIFLAIIAGVIIYRLHSVLGTRPDNDVKPPMPNQNVNTVVDSPVIADAQKPNDEELSVLKELEEKINSDSTLGSKMSDFKKSFPDFDIPSFLQGAKSAFEIITSAFAKGELKDMKELVSDNVYHSYQNIVDDRKSKEENFEFEIIRFVDVELKDANIEGDYAKGQVNFATEQVNVLKDKDGKVLSGSDSFINKVNDLWTFVRNIKSENPNWIMVAAKSG